MAPVSRKRNARLLLGKRGGKRRRERLRHVVLRNGLYLTRCRVIYCKKGVSDVRLMGTKVYAGVVSTCGIYAVDERRTMLGENPSRW
jgi:hypothetical protein